jgi:hypothetical protein
MAVPPRPTITTIEQRGINDLLTLLKQADAAPNILTLAEFQRFAPLYTEPKTKQDLPANNPALRALAEEFQGKINMYKPTHIVRSPYDPTVVLRLPQILIPLKTLSPTEANAAAVTTNYNYRNSDLPKVWSTAQNVMTSAVFREQNSPDQIARIAQVTTETREIGAEIDKAYGRTPAAAGSEADSKMLSADDFDDL